MRILIASALDVPAIERLQQDHDVICAFHANHDQLKWAIADREVLIFRSGICVDQDLLSSAPGLKLIIRAGCGLDNIDLNTVRARKLELRTIPQPSAKAVAEMALGLMLALARHIRQADVSTRQGRWLKHELEGQLLYGKVLGIVGSGNIGTRVGELGAAIGMDVIGCVEFPSPAAAERLAQRGIMLASFGELISTADIVSLHVPLKESTRKLIDADALARMRPGSFLVNLARGGVVDEAALYEALLSRRTVCAAALDVHQREGEGAVSPLAALPNVLLTPHIGAMTFQTQREIGERVVAIVREFAERTLCAAAAIAVHS